MKLSVTFFRQKYWNNSKNSFLDLRIKSVFRVLARMGSPRKVTLVYNGINSMFSCLFKWDSYVGVSD